MKRQVTRAFTLIELLVVITIIAVLLVLLIPGLSSAWQYAHLTRCKRNLNAIYTAYGSWRADRASHGQDTRLTGMAWRGQLVGYLEENREVFMCGSRWRQDVASAQDARNQGASQPSQPEQDWTDAEKAKAEADADQLANNAGGATDEWAAGSYVSSGPEPDDWAFEFDIWTQQGAGDHPGERNPNGPISADTPYGVFLRSISLGSPLVKKTTKETTSDGVVMHFETGDSAEGNYGDSDIAADIRFLSNRPVEVTPIKTDAYDNTESGKWRYIYDFKICGKILVKRWQLHFGEKFPVKSVLSPDESWRAGGVQLTDEGVADSWVAPLMGDYGLSRGSYETINKVDSSTLVNQPVRVPDGKQFFILDYPRPLADYLTGGNIGDTPDQNSYFVEDPRTWDDTKGPMAKSKPDKPWNYWQSLRHFGKANVLFCDGHVELVPGPNGATLDELSQFYYVGNIDSRQSDRDQVSALQAKLKKDFGIDQGFSPLWIHTNR
jgi:prepilin-type processing-associated H-X9-DG protein/prepilin-type N-terminal cleavage/methylation domain-containing protein